MGDIDLAWLHTRVMDRIAEVLREELTAISTYPPVGRTVVVARALSP